MSRLSQKEIVIYSAGCNLKNIYRIKSTGALLIVFGPRARWIYKDFAHDQTLYVYLVLPFDEVVRFKPCDVRCDMIEVPSGPVSFAAFDTACKNKTHQTLFDAMLPTRCKLYLNQRGAGCGKTFESVRLAVSLAAGQPDPRFTAKNTFIYLTKQHTAKRVILDEFIHQIQSLDLRLVWQADGKQYRFDLVNAENKGPNVIIGTIDSYFYALGDKVRARIMPRDFFSNLRQTILTGHREYDEFGCVKYARGDTFLNRRCLIIIDEAQDLDLEYIEALAVIQRGTHADLYVIGDKLQSIWGGDNAFTRLKSENMPYTDIEYNQDQNIVRRFRAPNLAEQINRLVRFSDYDLPPARPLPSINTTSEGVIWFPQISFVSASLERRSRLVDFIISHVDRESKTHGFLPHDFMFIFPIMRNNVLARYLESALQKYWSDRFLNDDQLRTLLSRHEPFWAERLAEYDPRFYQHAILHASDENYPINLDESQWSTRLLSIHASKGQGREVVFLLNMSEFALKLFSAGRTDLQYESLLHVALTRQKYKLYVGITGDTRDDIMSRFAGSGASKSACEDEQANPAEIRGASLRVTDIVRFVNTDTLWVDRLLAEYLQDKLDALDERRRGASISNHVILDWGHHVIRGAVMRHAFSWCVATDRNVQRDEKWVKKQLIAKMVRLAKMPVRKLGVGAYFQELRDTTRELEILPVLEFRSHADKYDYSSALCAIINGIQKRILDTPGHVLDDFCPIEALVLEHALQIINTGQFAEITAIKVYEILHAFHCNEDLFETTHISENAKVALAQVGDVPSGSKNDATSQSIRQSMVTHYKALGKIRYEIYPKFVKYIKDQLQDHSQATFFADHVITFHGRSSDEFKLWSKIPFVVVTEHNIILVLIYPTLDMLKQRDVCIEALFDTFVARHPPQETNNHMRFVSKSIHVCAISLNETEPIWFNFESEDQTLRECLHAAMCTHLEPTNRACISELYKHKDTGDAIEYTRAKLCANEKLPAYIREFLNMLEENDIPLENISEKNLSNLVYKRVARWLSLPISRRDNTDL